MVEAVKRSHIGDDGKVEPVIRQAILHEYFPSLVETVGSVAEGRQEMRPFSSVAHEVSAEYDVRIPSSTVSGIVYTEADNRWSLYHESPHPRELFHTPVDEEGRPWGATNNFWQTISIYDMYRISQPNMIRLLESAKKGDKQSVPPYLQSFWIPAVRIAELESMGGLWTRLQKEHGATFWSAISLFKDYIGKYEGGLDEPLPLYIKATRIGAQRERDLKAREDRAGERESHAQENLIYLYEQQVSHLLSSFFAFRPVLNRPLVDEDVSVLQQFIQNRPDNIKLLPQHIDALRGKYSDNREEATYDEMQEFSTEEFAFNLAYSEWQVLVSMHEKIKGEKKARYPRKKVDEMIDAIGEGNSVDLGRIDNVKEMLMPNPNHKRFRREALMHRIEERSGEVWNDMEQRGEVMGRLGPKAFVGNLNRILKEFHFQIEELEKIYKEKELLRGEYKTLEGPASLSSVFEDLFKLPELLEFRREFNIVLDELANTLCSYVRDDQVEEVKASIRG